MDILKLLLHPIHILDRIRIIELFFLLFDLPIKLDEVKLSGQRFQFRLIICSGELCLDLVKERRNDGLNKGTS